MFQSKIVGNLCFASGQVPCHQTGEIIVGIQEQTQNKFLKMLDCGEAGTGATGIDSFCFLSDINDLIPLTKCMQLPASVLQRVLQ